METLDTKITNLNQKFKSNAFVSSIVNILILVLVLVFFSIGFDLTKKLLFDFINLSWASIFPTMVDLFTVAGLILTLKKFSNILKSPEFFYDLENKKIEDEGLETNQTEQKSNENQPKLVKFLNNATLGKLILTMWSLIALFLFNCIFNTVLEGINDQLSPINEWYLLSSSFLHLPIFPINLLCIIVLVAIVLPTALNYAKYKLEIAEVSNLHPTKTINKNSIKEQVVEMKTYRFFIFSALSVMCIILSLIQRDNSWIFQYNKPISEEKVLAEKLTGKASAFCEENLTFNNIHKQNVMTATVSHISAFNSNPTTTTYNYPITPKLKQAIIIKCEKKAEEDKKIIEKRKLEDKKELEKALSHQKK